MKKKIKKNIILSKIIGSNYGFIDGKNMPKGEYTSNRIDYKGINWVKTGDLKYGKNHCATTTGTNIILYFYHLGFWDLLEKDEENTFSEFYKIVGNGPIIFLARKLKRYFKDRAYNLKYKRYSSFENVKDALNKNRPCSVLLSASLLNWHWIMAIGWREYESGEKYIQIVDSWTKNDYRFYKVKKSGIIISSTEYWI